MRRLVPLLVLLLTACSGDEPPGKSTTVSYVPPRPGLCERLDLDGLVRDVAEPGPVRESRVNPGLRDCDVRLGPPALPTSSLRVTVGTAGSPDVGLPTDAPYAMVRALGPLEGWWAEGNQAIDRSLRGADGPTRLHVTTVVRHGNLEVEVVLRNEDVSGEPERTATLALTEQILDRVRERMTPIDD